MLTIDPKVRSVRAWATLRSLPSIRLRLDDDATGQAMVDCFHTRGRAFPFLRWGTWGRAGLELPAEPGTYDNGRSRHALRKNCARAERLGYGVERIDVGDYDQALTDCYRSSYTRQGEPVAMTAWPFPGEPGLGQAELFGCRQSNGKVVAVCRLLISGQVVWVRNLIGHVEHLPAGVMYLLFRRVVEDLVESGTPQEGRWLLFDNYFDGSEGLQYFSNRVGLFPHNVHFTLAPPVVDRPAVAPWRVGPYAIRPPGRAGTLMPGTASSRGDRRVVSPSG